MGQKCCRPDIDETDDIEKKPPVPLHVRYENDQQNEK